MMGERAGRICRSTKETVVTVDLSIDGTGRSKIASGFPFLDHCLETLTLHAAFDLELSVESERPDLHHTAEDIGWTLGEALRACCLKPDPATGVPFPVQRFGWAVIPFDAILVLSSVDLVGRPGCHIQSAGGLNRHDIAEFFSGLSMGSAATVHLRVLQDGNLHHELECAFKATGRALRQAVAVDPILPEVSAKGVVKYETP